MTFADKAVDLADKMNKPRAFELGDRVIHKLTQRSGRVLAIERIGETNQMLTVELNDGKIMRGIRGSEFGLNTGGVFLPGLQKPSTDAIERFNAARAEQGIQSGRWEATPEMTGPIDGRSMLDELC